MWKKLKWFDRAVCMLTLQEFSQTHLTADSMWFRRYLEGEPVFAGTEPHVVHRCGADHHVSHRGTLQTLSCTHTNTQRISLKSRSKALITFELDVETRKNILWLRLWNYSKMRWAQTSLLQQAHFSPHRRLHGNRFLSNNIQEALHEASWSAASPQWKPPKHTNFSTSELSLTKTLQ